jgi:excisionase family DNA binding protein
MTEVDGKKPLGVVEAAKFTGLSPNYLYKLVHFRKIPFYKPTGGRLFFKQEDLEKFIFRGRVLADYEAIEKANGILNGTAVHDR